MTNLISRPARAARDALLSANPLAQLILVLAAALVLVVTVYVMRDYPPVAFVLHTARVALGDIGGAFAAVWRVL